MWFIILKRRAYFQDMAVNGIDIHLERRVLGCMDCIHIALSRDQRWDVLNPLIKPSMP
jgi:hypothetical protein